MPRLDDVCAITMGQSPDSSTYNKERNGLPFFQGNADFGEIHPSVRMWCSEPSKIARENDILISVRAPIGALNIANCECCIGRGLAALTVNNDICTREYLWYALSSKIDELNSKGTGSTFKAVNKSTLSETEIPLPPLDEQRHIAATLDKVTDLISKRRQQLDKLNELVKARFVEMFGDTIINPHELPSVSLSNLANIVSGITKGRKTKGEELFEVPYMAVSNVKSGYIDWTTVKTIEATKSEIEQYHLQPFDVLMTEGGDPDKLGRGAIIQNPPKDCIHQNHIFRVRVDSSCLLPQYLEEYLQHPKAKKYFLDCAKQTTGIASINMTQLRNLPVLLPSLEQQKKFSDFTEQISHHKLTIQRSLDKMETLKKALMQEYFD